jgi:hypothetical protein
LCDALLKYILNFLKNHFPVKKIILAFFLLCSLPSFFSQVKTGTTGSKSGAPGNSVQGKYSQGQTQSLVSQQLHPECLNKKFSVVFYLIDDSTYSLANNLPNALASYHLNTAINNLNKAFSPICVSFEHCKTVIIPHYTFNEWRATDNGMQVLKNWYTENTINIYVPLEFQLPLLDPPNSSYSFPPPTGPNSPTFNAVVVTKSSLNTPNLFGTPGDNLLHAMGHFFGLPHTYDEINPAGSATVTPAPPFSNMSLEYVSRTNAPNCHDHGDGFCDTEADPYPYTGTPNMQASGANNCAETFGLKDGRNDSYTAPCDNLMSAYLAMRCRFTPEQYNHMAKIISTLRFHLH